MGGKKKFLKSKSAYPQDSPIFLSFMRLKIKKNTKQTFFLPSVLFWKWNSTMFRWHPLIMLWLVQKCAWSAKSHSPTNVSAAAEIPAQSTIKLLSLQSRGTCMGVYIHACSRAHTHTHTHTHTCERVSDSEKEVPLGIWLQHW